MVIKTLGTQNPFSDYGTVVKGVRFAGRRSHIQTIHNRVLGENFGNLAIMGMPRIGKTSLAWNSLMPIKEELLQKRNLISFIYVARISTSNDFFKQLIYETLEELNQLKEQCSAQIIRKLNSIYSDLRKTENDKFEFNNHVQKFYKLLKRNRIRATYILDEFDSVSSFLTIADFQTLRQLASQPETQICLITVSRRTIQEIEPENGSISNFYGIFSDLRLGLFDKEDILEYWNSVASFDIEISEAYKKNVQYLVGNHPFLIDLYNYEVFNLLKKFSKVNNDSLSLKIESELKLNLYNNFENILNLMREEGLYSKAIQLILGPIYDVTSLEEQRLLKYEFIRHISSEEKIHLLKRDLGVKNPKSNISYACFSDYFTELLNLKSSEVDYWPLWSQTEKLVRELIKEYIDLTFGDNWELGYYKRHEKSEGKLKAIEKLDEIRSYSKNKFGSLASSHLVDYTFPRDMYDLFISSDWIWFEKVLQDSKSEWGKRFNTLADIRNPISHNNLEFVSAEVLKSAKEYCEIIIQRITKWRENKN